MKPPSNPVTYGLENRSFQAMEQPTWIEFWPNGKTFSICGDLQTAPPAFDVAFSWGANSETKTTLPGTVPGLRSDWCYLFDSIRMVREAMLQPANIPIRSDWARQCPANLQSANCHWASQLFGPTRQVVLPAAPAGTAQLTQLNDIINAQWFLFYCNDSASILGTPAFTVDEFSTELFVEDLLPFASVVTDGTFFEGWVVALTKRIIGLDDPENPTPVFHALLLYQLRDADFRQDTPNVWTMKHNALGLPDHFITTYPIGP